jgi:acyl-CoA thioester hydrolase
MRKLGISPVEIEFTVPFHDVDMARIVWHGRYVKYLENARWALMKSIGYTIDEMLDSGDGWPIVDLQIKYIQMARFESRLRVRASLIEWEYRLVINYLITNAVDGTRVARAQTTQVAVDMRTGRMRPALPEAFVSRVDAVVDRAGS